MTLKYSSVKGFWSFLGLNLNVMSYQPGQAPARDKIATEPAAGKYYLKQLGVNPETLTLYIGDTDTELIITTDYTFNSDTSCVTLTSAGAAKLTSDDLKAEYEYCELGKTFNFTQTESLLKRAEGWLETQTNTVFANQTDANPRYLQIVNEKLSGQGYVDNVYSVSHYPLVKLETTVAVSFSTNNDSLVLQDATGFPASGTILVGTHKLTYTAKAGNALTVPLTTPDIPEGSIVRGEVIEVSSDGAGFSPNFIILRPDIDYVVDHDTGDISILSSDLTSFFRIESSRPIEGVDNRVRTTYFTAWHEPSKLATIPEDLEEIVYLKAGLLLLNRTMLKANVNLRENFNASNFNITEQELERMLEPYKIALIGKA